MQRIQSPLRYPGSKARMADRLAGLLERNMFVGSHLYEPFAGGAAVSLNLLANGLIRSATLVELDPLVYSFWKCVKEQPDPLVERIQRGKISLLSWKRLEPLRSVKKPSKSRLVELAYAGLFFNRTCFSGIIGAGPIGGMSQSSQYKIDCRFNQKEIIKSIRGLHLLMKNVDIRFGDGIAFLEDECLEMLPHSLAYIDPPYVANGHKLYRYFFSDIQHKRLSVAISKLKVPWLLSYDNHPFIVELYGPERAAKISAWQSLKGARFVDELLLLSHDFEVKETKHSLIQRVSVADELALYKV